MPPKVFPVNSVKAMRGCIWLDAADQANAGQAPQMVRFARAVFKAYWADQADISQDDVLTDICEATGINVEAFFEGIAQVAIKDQLKANTEEVIRRGGFGSPTMFVEDDMYFGNDRLELLRSTVLARRSVAK